MPKKTKPLPSLARLNELFIYRPDSGKLIRKIASNFCAAGEEAGYANNIGYRQVAIDGTIYSVHRICWTMHHGRVPSGEIDHINGNRSDNRDENLREVTSSQNNQNRRLSSRNKTGIKGVFRVKWGVGRAWRVAVGHDGGKYYITHFQCFGQAVRHAKCIRAQLHAEFANNGHVPISEAA